MLREQIAHPHFARIIVHWLILEDRMVHAGDFLNIAARRATVRRLTPRALVLKPLSRQQAECNSSLSPLRFGHRLHAACGDSRSGLWGGKEADEASARPRFLGVRRDPCREHGVFLQPGGSGPTSSMPAIGFSSLI